MGTQDAEERLKHLYHMLLEMATGNLCFRNAISTRDDEIDKLIALLHTLAEQMKKVSLRFGIPSMQGNIRHLLQLSFILDKAFTIKGFSLDVPVLLGHSNQFLFERKLSTIIGKPSLADWKRVEVEGLNPSYHATIPLTFVCSDGKLMPFLCTISRLFYSRKILVSAITVDMASTSALPENDLSGPSRKLPEAELMQNVYDFVLSNLENPLPSLKEISKLFGINEFKLKAGFRHFFNNSIYQFYTEERLKRAHLMLQQTDLPIKTIALMNGFSYYVNFGKAFKKKFGYAPSEVSRNFRTPDQQRDAP